MPVQSKEGAEGAGRAKRSSKPATRRPAGLHTSSVVTAVRTQSVPSYRYTLACPLFAPLPLLKGAPTASLPHKTGVPYTGQSVATRIRQILNRPHQRESLGAEQKLCASNTESARAAGRAQRARHRCCIGGVRGGGGGGSGGRGELLGNGGGLEASSSSRKTSRSDSESTRSHGRKRSLLS